MSAEVKETVFGTSKSEKVEAAKVASTPKDAEVKKEIKKFKVKATSIGFYKNRRIEPDQVFEIEEGDFSKYWMTKNIE